MLSCIRADLVTIFWHVLIVTCIVFAGGFLACAIILGARHGDKEEPGYRSKDAGQNPNHKIDKTA